MLCPYQRSCALSVYQGHDQAVWAVATAPVGPYFVTGSLDHTACLWTVERTEPLRIFAGHLADVDAVAFHPNCNYVATASLDLSIRLWDINSGSCVRCVFHCYLLPQLRGWAQAVRPCLMALPYVSNYVLAFSDVATLGIWCEIFAA